MIITDENYGTHARRLDYLLTIMPETGSKLDLELVEIARALEDFESTRIGEPLIVEFNDD